MPRLRRRRACGAVAAVLVLLFSGSAAHAAAGPTDEQIDDAEDRVEELDEDIRDGATLQAEVEDRLSQLDTRLAQAAEESAEAERRAADAQVEAERAAAEVDRTEAELVAARSELRDNRQQLDAAARSAWMHGGSLASPTIAAVSSLTRGADLDEAADRMHLLEVVVEGRSVQLEDTQTLVQRTEQLQLMVRSAEADASARSERLERARLEAAERSADVLALVGAAEQAVQEQRDELARLEGQRESADDDLRQLEQAREDSIEAAAEAVRSRPVADGLVSVSGITVAASLAPALEDLLEAAYADGIVLTGYGYRSPETTARLRRANGCPDVYDSPAGACRVPTARPGESVHEQGLAVDFNYQGRTLCYPRSPASCVGNPAFDWLTANAGRYGLQVLSTEAWHWSTNGS